MRDTRYNNYSTKAIGYNKKYAEMWDNYVNSCFNNMQADKGNEHDMMIHVVDKYMRQLERTCKTQRGIKMPAILRAKDREAEE